MASDGNSGQLFRPCWVRQHRLAKICNASRTLQNDPFTISSSVLWTYFIGFCHAGVPKRFSGSISLPVNCLYTCFLVDQIPCRSYLAELIVCGPLQFVLHILLCIFMRISEFTSLEFTDCSKRHWHIYCFNDWALFLLRQFGRLHSYYN